jgi:hypothetical protein
MAWKVESYRDTDGAGLCTSYAIEPSPVLRNFRIGKTPCSHWRRVAYSQRIQPEEFKIRRSTRVKGDLWWEGEGQSADILGVNVVLSTTS